MTFEPGLVATLIMFSVLVNLIAMVVVTLIARGKIGGLLSNCSIVLDSKAAFGGLGFMGDMMRVGLVGSILVMPNIYAKKQFIDVAQVEAFPRKLKLLIVCIWTWGFILFLAMLGFRLFIYIHDVHPG